MQSRMATKSAIIAIALIGTLAAFLVGAQAQLDGDAAAERSRDGIAPARRA